MGSLGFPEILVIMLLALLVFGPKKLPEVGRIVGRIVRELRKASRELTSSIDTVIDKNKEDRKGR